MPLIFGDYSIEVLNGPSRMNILLQNDIPGYNQYFNNNTIILFGEFHTLAYFQPCNGAPNCNELFTDFILKLNVFAEHIKTEFYKEKTKKNNLASASNEFNLLLKERKKLVRQGAKVYCRGSQPGPRGPFLARQDFLNGPAKIIYKMFIINMVL